MTKWLRWAFTAAVIVMLVLFAQHVNWRETWEAARHASMSLLLLATVVNLVSLAIKAVRWWVFLRSVGVTSLGLALRATIAGAGLNNILVANAGDAARVVFVSRSKHVPGATILATLALERFFEIVGFVMLLAGSAFFLKLPPQLARLRWPALEVLIAMIAGVWWLLQRGGQAPATPVASSAPQSWRARAGAFLRRFAASVGSLSSGPRFAYAMLLSILVWVTQVATYAITAMAAHAPLPLAGNVAVVLAVNAGLVIRATPGNVGFFQLMYTLMAAPFGIPTSTAIAVSVLIQALQIIPVTLIGVALAPEFVFARARHAARPDAAPIEKASAAS